MSKDQSSALTPLFQYALTVLNPCGVTQAMTVSYPKQQAGVEYDEATMDAAQIVAAIRRLGRH